MAYLAKATVYLKIESNYPDGVGEAQREVGQLISELKNVWAMGPDGAEVQVARAIDIDILNTTDNLFEKMGECDMELWLGEKCLDNGMR